MDLEIKLTFRKPVFFCFQQVLLDFLTLGHVIRGLIKDAIFKTLSQNCKDIIVDHSSSQKKNYHVYSPLQKKHTYLSRLNCSSASN